MAKKVKVVIKLYCTAGSANPAPPVGPALGQHGLNIMQFCKAFNDKTKGQEGLILPVVITAYEDRSFTFIIKSPPSSVLLKRACGIAKASGSPNKEKVGQVTRKQVEEIAKTKMKDLNANALESAMKIIEGTARSMGIEVVEKLDPSFKPATGGEQGPEAESDEGKSQATKKTGASKEEKSNG